MISFYDAVIPTYAQILCATIGLIDRLDDYCAQTKTSFETFSTASLAPDMRPFAFQITSMADHSAGAIQALAHGRFTPDVTASPQDRDSLRTCLIDALQTIERQDRDALNALVGRPMLFEFAEYRMAYRTENFILSFSQPSFFFHATTAYDILRMKGLPLTKHVYLGHLRLDEV